MKIFLPRLPTPNSLFPLFKTDASSYQKQGGISSPIYYFRSKNLKIFFNIYFLINAADFLTNSSNFSDRVNNSNHRYQNQLLMISEEHLAKEFATVVEHFYPTTGNLLHRCYVKVINSYWGRPAKNMQYVGIYCPEEIVACVQAQKDVLREVAEHMGLVEVVCLNATRLLRDPMSKLKKIDPQFWLELHWIATYDK